MAKTGLSITLTESDVPPLVRSVPAELDAVILPGVPGWPTVAAEKPEALPDDHYPSTTTDIIKVLREANVKLDYADRGNAHAEVAQKAADWWLPVIVFLEPAAAHTVGALMAEATLSLLGKRAERAVLHVKLGKIQKRGGTIRWLEAHGNGKDVLEALKMFDAQDGG